MSTDAEKRTSDSSEAYGATLHDAENVDQTSPHKAVEIKEDSKEIKDKKAGAEPKVSMSELFNFATKFDVMLMSVGLFAAIAAGAGMPLMTIIFGGMVNEFGAFSTKVIKGIPITPAEIDSFRSTINQYTLYFIYLAIGIFVTTYAYMSTWVYAGERQTRKVRESYLAAVLRQDIAWFDKLGAGEITTRITSDTHLIQDGISEKFPQSSSYVATFISAFIIAFIKSWKLTLVLSCIIPMIAVSVGVLNVFTSRFAKRALDHYSISGTLAEEVISSIRTATAFGQQKKLSEMYNKNIADAKKEGLKKAFTTGLGIGVIFFIIYCAYSLASWFGGRLITDGTLEAGDVFNVFFAVIIGAFSLGHVAPNLQAFALAQGAAAKLYEAIYRVPQIDSCSSEGLKPTTPTKGLIEARNLRFHYPSRPDVPILKGISLTVEPGKTVALVGMSGSGKSTIIQLLERFYDPIEGEISLDGTPIKSLNVHWLRRQIGLVSQEPTLFKCTIAENVAHGLIGTPHEKASKEKQMELIEQACKMANAHDFIMTLPEKYDTHVGERGFLLSGGQKQRIAIARAIVKDPRILLLDEATSALDTQSEGIVQQALDRASSGRTTIVIAHRLSTIRNADQIIVMDRGDIIESGDHNSLLKAEGAYYKLVELQKIGNKDNELDAVPPPEDQNLEAIKSKDSELRRQTTVRSILSVGSRNDIEEDAESKYSFAYVCFRVLKLNRPELKFIIIGLIAAIISGVIYPIMSIVFSGIIDAFGKKNTHDINFWALMFLIIAIVMFCSQTIQGTSFGISGERLTERIRSYSFNAILQQEIGWFDREQNSTGTLVSALSTDATHVQGVSGATFGTILQVTSTVIGGFIIGLAYGWKLTLVVMTCVPLLMGAGVIRMRMMNGYQLKTKAAYEHSAQLACEAASSIRTVASLTREQDVCDLYHKELEEPVKEGKKNAFGSSMVFAISQAIVFLANALGFWYGGRLMSTFNNGSPEYDQKQFFVVFIAIVFGAQSAGNVFSFVPDLSKAKSAASSIIGLLDRKPLIDTSKAEGDKVDAIEGHITYKDVHFRYPTRPGVPVLRGLNLDIKPGQYAALVGPSGCGKSTVIGLTERFYDVLSGSVMIDGKDVRQMNINDMRKHIALVGQEPTLYDMTIKENICFGLVGRTPSQEEIEKAARDSNIHDFIMSLPLGYDTPLGGKGSQLSGGQKQRIAIARALIRHPKILLLDEATSALDAASEKVVQTALDTAAKGRTTIAVAHRLSTIQKADVIYVFKNGVVNEKGTHDELMALKGQYYALVIQQDLSGH
ncbi:P-loop containing nucleoside triphosphate hydrolase protein [Basidiobolus meristosporus CBS 931.73]|uniref:p-loop containing nucleoside triphosphate hydrolase protein n=1 Tax=Basidiobolus meristosporus CBS 931.73 TaxID=1314790 RepID=A0A1Y1XY89_9FUNG|nr:P-loop containing nucleoside triphosphate hydrolase protein [Basidiobolus meristosporus CBS 931.73]|eukprot:ORX90713.1 P-loop containing nucleoside triphosphate hydrolase protein [Basidiobolus meristosporus CBS 931.73]